MRSICWSVVSRFAIGRGSIPLRSARCSTNASQVKESTSNEKEKFKVKRYKPSKHSIDVGRLFTKDIKKSNWTGEKRKKVEVNLPSKNSIDVGRVLSKEFPSRPSPSHGPGETSPPPSPSHGQGESSPPASLSHSPGDEILLSKGDEIVLSKGDKILLSKGDDIVLSNGDESEIVLSKGDEILLSKALKEINKEKYLNLKQLIVKINSKMAEFESHQPKQIILVAGLKKIEKWGKKVQIDDFDNIMSYFVNNYDHFSRRNLRKCVQLILMIHNPDKHTRDLLVNIIAGSLGNLFIRQLISLCFLNIENWDFKTRIQNECLEELGKRLDEITDPLQILKVLNVHRNEKNKHAMIKFENRIIDVVDTMSLVTVLAVLMLLSKNCARNTPVILSLIHHLRKSTEELTVDQMRQILWSCARLSIYDETLMTNICNDLLFADLSDSYVCFQILVQLGKLQWREKNLLSTLINNIFGAEKPKLSDNKERDIVNLLCHLNYCPDNLLELLQLNNMDLMMRDTYPLSWLSLVWDCTVLQKATAEMMSSVLDKNFLKTVEQKCGNHDKFLVYKSKLININCASCFDIKNYDGPRLSDANLKEVYVKKKDKSTIQLIADVIQCMDSILPETDYYRKDVVTPYGYRLEAELFVNSYGEAVKLHDTDESQEGLHSNGEAVKLQDTDKSQEGIHRVGLKVLGFKDTLKPDKIPTGPEAMMIRHLDCQGYRILLVPYYEWNDLTTPEKKKEYLENKIKSVIS